MPSADDILRFIIFFVSLLHSLLVLLFSLTNFYYLLEPSSKTQLPSLCFQVKYYLFSDYLVYIIRFIHLFLTSRINSFFFFLQYLQYFSKLSLSTKSYHITITLLPKILLYTTYIYYGKPIIPNNHSETQCSLLHFYYLQNNVKNVL